MKNILVIGATGQIGSELTMELRKRYGNTHVVAGYIHGAEPKGELKESGPSAVVDVTDQDMIASVVREYNIDTIYNLAALLSVVSRSWLGKSVSTVCGMYLKWLAKTNVPYSLRVRSVRLVKALRMYRHRRTLFIVRVPCMVSAR